MLQTYRDERINIARLKQLAESELNDELYPSATDYTHDKVQSSRDSGDVAEAIIGKVNVARKHLLETVSELHNRSEMLDKLLLEIAKLPAYQSRVIVGLYIDGKSEVEIGESMNRAEETICGYRKAAIRRLTKSVMGERIRTWRRESV